MNGNNIDVMSKIEMVNYLRDFAILQENYAGNDKCFIDLSTYYKNLNYSKRMCSVYNTYVNMRLFSIVEDYKNNNFMRYCDLYEIPSNITNKRLLELIRNAFNYNINNAFNITKNGRYVKLNINDVRDLKEIKNGGIPEGLKIKFDSNDLYRMFVTYDEDTIDISNNFDMDSNNLFNELDKIPNLTYEQKEKAVSLYNSYKKYNPNLLSKICKNRGKRYSLSKRKLY